MTDFLHMGGYGVYVWPSYAIALIIIVANVWAPLRDHKKLLRDIKFQLTSGKK